MLLVLCFVLFSLSSSSSTAPNIILFLADDMGGGDLGVYGHPTIQSPNLDRLAHEGIRFTQFYSGHPLCTPSRTAIVTGRYAPRSGMNCGYTGGVLSSTAAGGLQDNETTIAEYLRGVGFDTSMFGKHHMGQRAQYLPTARGFDSYLGVPYSVDMGASPLVNTSQTPLPLLQDTTIIEQPLNFATLTPRYVQHALDFVQAHGSGGANASRPFFLYAAFQHVHVPMFISPPNNGTSPRGHYGDGVAELDAAVGSIMDVIRADPLLSNNTLVAFTSDNGPWLIEGLNGGSAGLFYEGKGSTWEGGQRVPGIFWYPPRIAPLQTTMQVASHVDFLPTFLSLAGVQPGPHELDGFDLSPVLFEGQPGKRRYYFYWRGQDELLPNGTLRTGLWAARAGPYKAHFITKSGYGQDLPIYYDPPLLFNIEWDPSELYPLDTTLPVFAPIVAEIVAAAAAHRANVSVGVPNQCTGSSNEYALCADPNSGKKYPTLPNCTISPDNWNYRYPDPPGLPPPSDRRVPIDPVLNDFFQEGSSNAEAPRDPSLTHRQRANPHGSGLTRGGAMRPL